MMLRVPLGLTALLFLGCGTHLSDTDVEAEQATQGLSASGYAAHADDDAGLDLIRYQGIYCSSTGLLRRAGHATDVGGPQCPTTQ